MPISLPPSSAKAFSYKGNEGSVLLLHGYTGTPYDLKPLGLALKSDGYACYAPLLPGHATTPADLNRVSAEQMLQVAQKAYDALNPSKPRFIVGFSMGALLAALLAANPDNKVDGLILLAPAFRLSRLGRLATLLAQRGLHHLLPIISKPGKTIDTSDPIARSLSPAYGHIPIKGLLMLDNLRQQALQALPSLHMPILIALGGNDHTVDSLGVENILHAHLPCPTVTYWYPRSWHILLLDVERDKVIQDILQFIHI